MIELSKRQRAMFAVIPLLAAAFAPSVHGEATYVGTASCAGCHADEMEAWTDSHHDLAMQRPSEATVLGDFDNAFFDHYGVITRFRREGDRYLVNTDGPDGELRDYEVEWVFGVYPLQQYLLQLDRGRLQTLSVTWDARPAAEGGQRWYHLYPDEGISHDDPLHWTGPYQNWNTRCAECHSTDVKKNYDAASRTFDTTFFEEDVGCEACHGPGSGHVSAAKKSRLAGIPNAGFLVDLAARGEWEYAEGASIAHRRTALNGQQQIDTCGRCHARRGTLGAYVHGQPLSDTHRLSLLGSPLYHNDGQILDEVYVYGSFLQSKMHQAGVVCSNCHEPHSNKLRAEGNGICAQCHRPDVFDTTQHHHHPVESAGAQCANCHMPASVYMGVDARRDHSMRVPRPDLSLVAGSPNACTLCHKDQDDSWALAALDEWGVARKDTSSHVATAMAALQRGDTRSVPTLRQIAGNSDEPAIWRATALERAGAAADGPTLELARTLLGADDPLLRTSAVRVIQQLPPQQRFGLLAPMTKDPVTGVRLEVAMGLADIPLDQLRAGDQQVLLEAFNEYRQVLGEHADMPSMQLQLGLFHLSRGDFPSAEAAYREALHLNPQLVGAYLNLADLLRSQQREEEAREQLMAALAIAPESGDAMHALGLLEARARNQQAAMKWLGAAAQIETQGSRHRYVFAIAQHDFGDPQSALVTLRKLHAALPADETALLALTNYTAEAGNISSAERYARKLLTLDPNNANYQALARRLQAAGG
ncbi:MAG: tetratricopeptide repeat protein [Pseudomonadota bacterium]